MTKLCMGDSFRQTVQHKKKPLAKRVRAHGGNDCTSRSEAYQAYEACTCCSSKETESAE